MLRPECSEGELFNYPANSDPGPYTGLRRLGTWFRVIHLLRAEYRMVTLNSESGESVGPVTPGATVTATVTVRVRVSGFPASQNSVRVTYLSPTRATQ